MNVNMIAKLFRTLRNTNSNRCVRNYVTKLSQNIGESKSTFKDHIYNTTLFQSHYDLASHLKDKLLYWEHGLVVINKPYGIKRYQNAEPRFGQKKITLTMAPTVTCLNHLSIEELLPYLAKELGVPQLQVVKIPERYISGVTILCTNKAANDQVIKCFRQFQEPLITYTAVCASIPVQKSNIRNLGITVKKDPNSTKQNTQHKKTVLVDSWSKRSVLKGDIKPVKIYHDTLYCNSDLAVSKVEIASSTNKWNAVRTYLATYLLAPVLGDNLFGSRIRFINGVSVSVDAFSPFASTPQRLNSEVLSRLQITKGNDSVTPLHLHLSRIVLPNIFNRKDLILEANPPDFFSWTCDQLDLNPSNTKNR